MSNEMWIPVSAAVISVVLAALVIIRNSRRTKRTMDSIEKMLDAAMEGDFVENRFDESRLSALETKFAHYLSASAVSARNVAMEKDKIKTLIADISHQTKTPLANLILYCELLEEGELSEDMRGNVEALHDQIENLRFLIDSLVKLSRLENGILTLSPRREPIQPMLQGVLEQFAAKAGDKGLDLRVENTETYAQYDPKWTAEALCNIVDNAMKYTERGSIAITVTDYDMFVRIDVTDSGIGIAEGEQAKIFTRFYRSESVRDQEGVGIGLYFARQIIAGEGGYIKLTSVEGKGSTFSIFLPK
ncbi:MAG: HAMP domain-containing histidine kinase [Butyrivibrio sp.]|nr:HAMP domain-containing histidine kinase [Muribaculum sp.]MCM1551189.1 HAMP domain-containing histidine kinase [Butyrivibrio sp.]